MKVNVDALRRGEPAAYEAVYRTHLEDVMCMLQRGFVYTAGNERRFFKVASAFDREELCQEAFCEFFRQCQRGKFDPTRPIRPYLRRIVINLALHDTRRLYREVPMARPLDGIAGYTPPDALERREVVALMQAFQAELSTEDRALSTLYFEERSSQRIVGETLGLSRDQVYRKIQKIRSSALAFLRKRGWLDEP